MRAIVNAFEWLIDTIELLLDFVFSFLDSIALVFEYSFIVVNIAFNFITTLPSWLQVFGLVTISICSIYLVVDRNAGKSD